MKEINVNTFTLQHTFSVHLKLDVTYFLCSSDGSS